MTWNSGIALLGLLALGIPLWIHLLSRSNARVQDFPSLRFLGDAPLVQTRRSRLNDLLLLIVRLGTLALAVGALAQPILLTAARTSAASADLARAIVIDTSASMQRATASGSSALILARANAERLAREATASIVLETANPVDHFAGAAAWLDTRPGKRELIVLSDFHLGSIDSADVATLAPEIGLRLERSDSLPPPAGPLELRSRRGARELVATVSHSNERSNAQWTTRTQTDSIADAPLILTSTLRRADANAAIQAVLDLGTAPQSAGARPIAIVYRDYEEFAQVAASVQPLNAPWMGDIIAALRADSTLVAAMATATPFESAALTADTLWRQSAVALLRNRDGQAIVFAGRATIAGAQYLVLVTLTEPASFVSASLIAAVFAGQSNVAPVGELETDRMTSAALTALEREAGVAAPRNSEQMGGASDARWFWLAALLLLGVESLVRRSPRSVTA